MTPPYDICVCIITYNRIEYTKRCIGSFIANAPKKWSMVVVDNGSTDGTRQWLIDTYDHLPNVKVILAKRNLYPAGGNKLVLQQAFDSKYYLICDNDGLFVSPDWYRVGHELLQHNGIGLVNMRHSRWREDDKLGKHLEQHNGVRYWVTAHVATFSMVNEKVRGALVRSLSGRWIGKTIGRIAVRNGFTSVALVNGLIHDQSENDLNNPEYREQYMRFWKEKKRLKTFLKMANALDIEQGKGYRDPNRPAGSQSEQPTLLINADASIEVGGYQRYAIGADKRSFVAHTRNEKYDKCAEWLLELGMKSMTDLGCSNGLMCVMAALQPQMAQAVGLDHDTDCIDLLQRVAKHTDLPIEAKQYSFGDTVPPTEAVTALALVHWLFGCTANYQSFDSIFQYLGSMASKMLIVEWISPDDRAIRKFGHLTYGNTAAYNELDFVRAAKKIGRIAGTHQWSATRTLYLILK